MAVAAISQAACLAVPIPYPPTAGEVHIAQEELDQIEVGKTNRRDILRVFGVPDWAFGPQSRLIYKTRTLSTWQLGGCAIGMTSSYCADRWYDTEILDITLDDTEVVTRWEVLVPVLGERTASGIHLYQHDLMKVSATAEADLEAKEFAVPSEKCAVYLYAWRPARPNTTVRFQVDGDEDPYWFLDDSDFFRVDLDKGPHTVGVTVNWLKGVAPNSVALDCEAGNAYFLRVLIDGLDGASFDLVPSLEGRKAILDRDLLLLRDATVATK